MNAPHIDQLSVTVPQYERPVLVALMGQYFDDLGVNPEPDAKGFYHGQGSALALVNDRYRVTQLQLFGKFLALSRELATLPKIIADLSLLPERRITRVDLALDLSRSGPRETARVYRKFRTGRYGLSRKLIAPHNVSRITRPNAEGQDTGTVYLGEKKNASTRLKVYDKRQERLDAGDDDLGDLTRYELELYSRSGVEFADLLTPTPIYWHYVAPHVLKRPPGVSPWVPSPSTGFHLPKVERRTPYDRLCRLLEDSPDIARMLELAAEPTAGGIDHLCKVLRRRYNSALCSGEQAGLTA